MRAVVQRVNHSSVSIEGQVHSQVSRGLLVLLGVGKEDSEEEWMAASKKRTCSLGLGGAYDSVS